MISNLGTLSHAVAGVTVADVGMPVAESERNSMVPPKQLDFLMYLPNTATIALMPLTTVVTMREIVIGSIWFLYTTRKENNINEETNQKIETSLKKLNMKLIIAPTDFSAISDNAIKYATDMAAAMGANLMLVNVYQIPISFSEVPLVTI